jgi:hypothetical protein
MDYNKLKDEIKDIAEIAGTVPEPFREKCFELLLSNLLGAAHTQPQGGKDLAEVPTAPPPTEPAHLPIPTQLRIFMTRTGIAEDHLGAILMVAEGEVHFIREPRPKKISKGQKDWALLLALRNCILGKTLSVDPEDVRSICQDKGYYDRANFAAVFKRPKVAALFKGPMEAQGKAQQLTKEGEDELAKVILSLGEGNQ